MRLFHAFLKGISCKVKYKQPNPGFELDLRISFPTAINVTLTLTLRSNDIIKSEYFFLKS